MKTCGVEGKNQVFVLREVVQVIFSSYLVFSSSHQESRESFKDVFRLLKKHSECRLGFPAFVFRSMEQDLLN